MDITAAIASDELEGLLREHPELVTATDEHGVSALLLTLYHRKPDARDALLAAGAPVGPLEAAALGDVEALDGADLSVRGGDGFTPLHLAAFFGGAEAVRAILATGADPDADNENTFKVHPIHSAVAVGDHASVRALLEAGADLSVRGGDGFTPLHLAAFFGGAEAVRAILATGADPDADADNTFNVRPIHSAVAVGDHASARALLEAGADPNVEQQGGHTPLDAALHHEDSEMVELLRRHGAVSR